MIRRIDLDEEGWIRIGVTIATLGALTGLGFALAVSPALIYGGLAVIFGAPTIWLWRRHFEAQEILRTARGYDTPHRYDEPTPVRPPVDRPA